jgi:hypothetical protein
MTRRPAGSEGGIAATYLFAYRHTASAIRPEGARSGREGLVDEFLARVACLPWDAGRRDALNPFRFLIRDSCRDNRDAFSVSVEQDSRLPPAQLFHNLLDFLLE